MKLQQLLIKGYEQLKLENIDTYMLDAQLLLGKVLNKDKIFIMTNREFEVEEKKVEEYFKFIKLRKSRFPIKYILGECEFMGLNFKISEGVLIPRPDTEILVETTLQEIKNNSYINICDLCCGSGIIGLSIAKYSYNIKVECYDISDEACNITKENIKKLDINNKVMVKKSDLFNDIIDKNKKFDVIVSNPPYIKSKVIPSLMKDVKEYEPYQALCGGEDGLEFYKKITIQSKKFLRKGGILVFEIGYDQRKEVEDILKENNFWDIVCIKDLSENDRVIKAKI